MDQKMPNILKWEDILLYVEDEKIFVFMIHKFRTKSISCSVGNRGPLGIYEVASEFLIDKYSSSAMP